MSWKTVSLGDVAYVGAGNSAPQEDCLFENGTHNFYRTSDVGRIRTGVITESSDKLNLEGIRGLKLHSIGTILFPKSGASTFLNHRVMLNKEGYVSSHLATIKAKSDAADDRFLLHFLSTIDAKNLVQDSNYPSLKTSVIEKIVFLIPPLTTQLKIVAKLDAIFAEIDKAKAAAEANVRNAEALFQSYLNEIFERGGEDWNTYAFDEIVEDKQIGLVKNSKEQLEDGEFAYFKMNNILNNNKCDLRILARVNATKEELTKFRLVKNDFLFNTRNSTELVGKVCVFEGEERDNILYNNNIMRVRFKPFVSSKFIHQAFSYKRIKAELEKLKTGTTNVAAIYYKDLKNLKLSIPSMTQQNSILISLEKLDAITEGIKKQRQQKINELYKLKQSILRQAFEGQLVKE